MNANGNAAAEQPQECPVCKALFNYDANLPKALDCGHSVCAVCVPGCIRRGRATCPLCRQETEVPPHGLLTDYFVMRGEDQAARRPSADIQRAREALPIFSHRPEITRMIMYDSRVVILRGGTGSGKTTQLVQYIKEEMDYFARQGDHIPGLIGCTQPRVIAAKESAKRVAQEVGCRVGEEVGYHVRFDNCSSDRTKILFMTDGILVEDLTADPLLSQYAFIILDEAHVRSRNVDFLIPMLRETLEKRKDFKLIISRYRLCTWFS